jgi:hypothetical protein
MKLKLIALLLLPALMLLLACGGTAEPTPDIEAMVAARVKEALATLPTPTPVPTPIQTPAIVVKEVLVEVVKEVIVEKEVIKEIPVEMIKEVLIEDMVKVQSLEEDNAALDAMIKKLEEDFAFSKLEVGFLEDQLSTSIDLLANARLAAIKAEAGNNNVELEAANRKLGEVNITLVAANKKLEAENVSIASSVTALEATITQLTASNKTLQEYKAQVEADVELVQKDLQELLADFERIGASIDVLIGQQDALRAENAYLKTLNAFLLAEADVDVDALKAEAAAKRTPSPTAMPTPVVIPRYVGQGPNGEAPDFDAVVITMPGAGVSAFDTLVLDISNGTFTGDAALLTQADVDAGNGALVLPMIDRNGSGTVTIVDLQLQNIAGAATIALVITQLGDPGTGNVLLTANVPIAAGTQFQIWYATSPE